MDTLRSKNDFAFESDDSNLPYMVEKILVGTQRVAAFNYSSEYFRKKKSSDKGMYRIIGGNIPSDMSSSQGFTFEEGSLSCNLNKGTGKPDKPLPVLNLTPNRIKDTDPYHCQPANTIVRGPTLPPISKEAGKDQKSNHMYIPVYQHSCSDHPRAKGFAHEDSYSCLHRFNSMSSPGWRQQKFSCDSAAGCIQSVKAWSKSADGKWSAMENAVKGFSCLETNWGPSLEDLNNRVGVCGSKDKRTCKAGYVYSNSMGAGGNVCDGGAVPYKPVGSCPSKGAGYVLTASSLYSGYTFSWPREKCTGADCDCLDGSITVSASDECSKCSYICCDSTKCTKGDVVIEYNCKAGEGSSAEFCGCAFQKEESYGTVSTFEDPDYPFPNWSRLGFVGKTVGVLPCRGLELTCDDVI
jgi:hypothetical protein